LCVPAIGRAQPVRIAVPGNCPRNFPLSPLPAPAIVPHRRPGTGTAGAAVAAGIATDIELFGRVGMLPTHYLFRDGDTPHDIRCGRFIGAKILAVATGGAKLDELKKHQPDWAVEDLTHINAREICGRDGVSPSLNK